MALTSEQSKALANSIINNLESHTVNRQEKMARSINQLAKNTIRKQGKAIASEFNPAEARGYGNNNTKTGD